MSLIKMGVASIFLLAGSFVQAEETFPNKNIHFIVGIEGVVIYLG